MLFRSFAEVEQIAFAPAHMVEGIEPSPDKMLQVNLRRGGGRDGGRGWRGEEGRVLWREEGEKERWREEDV